MGKLAQSTSKYTIHANFDADGIVERPDVIGAIFGQTEGLLGADMDLRELQKTGRVGRINVKVNKQNGHSKGVIEVPSSLDASETALIAATLETIERVGPCDASIEVEKVEDIRATKRKYLVKRAKRILTDLFEEGLPESQEMSDQIKEAVRTSEITDYEGLPCGPNIMNYDSIVVCEGRADVVNLLKHGVKNVIAIEGTSIPQPIIDLSHEKTTTVMLDGDRGGDLILKEMLNKNGDIDYVARAPEDKEVEELTKKEIYKSLREKITIDQARAEEPNISETKQKKPELDDKMKERFTSAVNEITGTRAAYFLDSSLETVEKVPIKKVFDQMSELENVENLVFDGSVNQKLINEASKNGIKRIIGMEVDGGIKNNSMMVLTEDDL
ncbi:MAG: DNA primase DnaG [Candidatus Aenigmatarchaeota archaeon]